MSKWRVPDGAGWTSEFFFICFNDDCSYYKNGWAWMKEQYNHRASYRYYFDPETGTESMLPVWSDTAARELIVENDE